MNDLSIQITHAFSTGLIDLTARPGAPQAGWDAMPESIAATILRGDGASDAEVRVFVTLVSAMDRARDADRLWKNATRLWLERRWCFDPEEIGSRPLIDLSDALRSYKVSLYHINDVYGWRTLAESLLGSGGAESGDRANVRRAVFEGDGDAAVLLASLKAVTSAGTPSFPYLAGPKVGPMWVRLLAWPGNARIENVDALPVAVDVQVRRITENLGVTDTRGKKLELVRESIQTAWRNCVAESGADGPSAITGACAALDPVLWFVGKWGCSYCERKGRKLPVAQFCDSCQLGSQHAAGASV